MTENLYVDFDSTLFDSDKYLHELYNICEKYNVKNVELDHIMKKLFENTPFFIDDLLDYLLKEKRVNKNIQKDFQKLEKKSYVYKDTICFLKSIQDKYNPILLTCGHIAHQQKKIKTSNIEKYFSNIIITPGNKSQVKEVDYKNSIFIDNNPKEIERFITVGAKRVIRIKRDSDKYSKIDLQTDGIEEYSSLYEVLESLGITQDEYLLLKTECKEKKNE